MRFNWIYLTLCEVRKADWLVVVIHWLLSLIICILTVPKQPKLAFTWNKASLQRSSKPSKLSLLKYPSAPWCLCFLNSQVWDPGPAPGRGERPAGAEGEGRLWQLQAPPLQHARILRPDGPRHQGDAALLLLPGGGVQRRRLQSGEWGCASG